jgi:hypothetical protein
MFKSQFVASQGPERLFQLYQCCLNPEAALVSASADPKVHVKYNPSTLTYSISSQQLHSLELKHVATSFSKHTMILLERIHTLLSVVFKNPPPMPTWDGRWVSLQESQEAAIYQLGEDIAHMMLE